MSRPGDGRPAVPQARGGQPPGAPGWPSAAPPHRPLGAADPAAAGPYRLEAVLGAGGMGRVYLARTPAGSPVAVKVVHREYAGDPAFRRRFALEVAAARRVQGLYTVPVVDADLAAEEPWLATAYVPGPAPRRGRLGPRLRPGRQDPRHHLRHQRRRAAVGRRRPQAAHAPADR